MEDDDKEPAPVAEVSQTKVFLSYSRNDLAFALRVQMALTARRIEVFRDVDDTLPSEEWWKRLKELIDSADSVVFLLTTHSAASKVCAEEVAYAVEQGKRVFPAVISTVNWADVPDGLAKRQSVFLTEDFESNIEKLATGLLTDIEWVREHTRLQGLAIEWNEHGRRASDRLRGRSLDEAERWMARRPADLAAPGESLRDFLSTSRKAERQWSRRWLIGASSAALGSAALAGYALVQRNIAVSERNTAQAERDRALANLAISNAYDARGRDAAEAMNHALNAWRLQPGDDAHRAVLRCYYDPDAFPARLIKAQSNTFDTTDSWFSASFFPDSQRILARDLSRPASVLVIGLDGSSTEIPLGSDKSNIARTVPRMAPDGQSFAVYQPQRNLVSVRAIDGAEKASIQASGVEVLIFSNDSAQLAFGWSAGGKNGVSITSPSGGQVVVFDELTNRADDLAFSPDGSALAIAADKKLWLIGSNGRLDAVIEHPDYVTGVAYSPKGETIATTCWDAIPRLWWSKEKTIVKAYKGHSSRTYSPRFSPDGKWLATASWDGTVRVWNGGPNLSVSANKTLPIPKIGSGYNNVEWSPNGRWLATAGNDKSLAIWDMQTPRWAKDGGLDRFVNGSPLDWLARGYALGTGYRSITVTTGSVRLVDLPIEFKDRIWRGKFTPRGGLVETNAGLYFPFHPDVIETVVFEQGQFGRLKRVRLSG